MQVELIHEPIDIHCTFMKDGNVRIHRIRHETTIYHIRQLTCNWHVREGDQIIDKFTVKSTDGDTLWISWNRTQRIWVLDEIHMI